MSSSEDIIQDIKKKIEREKNILLSSLKIKKNTNNSQLISKCNNSIREARQNLNYLEETLKNLSITNQTKPSSLSDSISNQFSSNSKGSTYSPSNFSTSISYDSPANSDISNTNINFNRNIPYNPNNEPTNNKLDKNFMEFNQNSFKNLGPAISNTELTKYNNNISATPLNFTRLDLLKYDCPSLGHRIQYMLQQLKFKLQIENQYKEGTEKMVRLYEHDGDRHSSSVAAGGRIEINQKIPLLKRALKRYNDMHLDIGEVAKETELLNTSKLNRIPISGVLTIRISSVKDVDHITTSSRFSKKIESVILIKIDDDLKAKTKVIKNDKWNEEFQIYTDKGNEIELSVCDKINDRLVPVAIMWFMLSDVIEEIRKKKVIQGNSGWVAASKMHNQQFSSNSNGPSPIKQDSPKQSSFDIPTITSMATNPTSTVNPSVSSTENQQITSSNWFILEPAGQILLTLAFQKTSEKSHKNPTNLGALGRHGAIRQRKEEVFEQHGHQFTQRQFYNIMQCGYCGEFLRYTCFQCQDCRFLCHKKCYQNVVTKCISKSSFDISDEAKLNHRIPHRFEPVYNKSTKWCCHCGFILPFGKKNVRKCTECGIMCHANCAHLVPDFCGMSMKMANEVLKTIQSTNNSVVSPRRKKIAKPLMNTQDSDVLNNPNRNSYISQNDRVKSNKKFTSNQIIPSINIQTDYDKSDDFNTNTSSTNVLIESESQITNDPTITSLSPERKKKISYSDSSSENQFDNYSYSNQYTPTLRKPPSSYEPQSPEPSNHDQSPTDGFVPLPKHQSLNQLQFNSDVIYHSDTHSNGQFEPEGSTLQNKLSDYSADPQKQETTYINPQTNLFSNEIKNLHNTPEQQISNIDHHRKHRRRKVGLDDFQFLAVLGKGNFGKVMLAESRHTHKLCAIKVLKKDFILEHDEVESTMSEKRVFLAANRERHPFLINLHCCFQTENRIYFVMEYVPGGDLMWHIQKQRFSQRRAQFYAAEVLLGLKYFHDNGIIYRDLKLDNIMLAPEGHIKIGDYGLCKEDMWYGNTTSTFCGTPEFMAPEILKEQKYGKAVDWWAFGVLLYQMLLAQSPFKGDDGDEVFNAILTDEPLYPIQMASDAVSILQALLHRDPEKRLGAGPRDAEEVMNHPYFKKINFDDVLHKRTKPPYIPEIKSEVDVSNFDEEFTSETPKLTPVNSLLTSDMQEKFRGFSHMSDEMLVLPQIQKS
ncbi:uncharacterized protein ASCRUDRAFT_9189 [Ascoidea rubescens DSM 1968]|uniref:protein kinase C n=1 Tax=Ascoidea rubescens DSM 1968 TaxID=1344418 RepID=A0A1D2VCZ5_9ASCO|nr:hypothetical protein ASCRUDRAFT_9189 [Ascoidea rubescens DSM 1968]ODV59505.1 hypothetical protein ASCRUDRAFT_9189 [Ascoidea rubescens DSM 1968]